MAIRRLAVRAMRPLCGVTWLRAHATTPATSVTERGPRETPLLMAATARG